MLTVDVVTTPPERTEAAVLAVGVLAPPPGEREVPVVLPAAVGALAQTLELDLAAELALLGFEAGVGQVARVPTRGRADAPLLLVVGLGPAQTAGTLALRRAAAAVANAAERVPSVAVALHQALTGAPQPPVELADALQAVAEGLHLGAYRFAAYQRDPRPFELASAALVVGGDADAEVARAAAEVARITAGAALLARDLVNTPPQDKRPPALADRAVAEVAGLDIAVRVLDEQALADGGYGGLIGVGQGSAAPPRLVELTYAPPQPTGGHVALVGKGITFDTGGVSLKPSAAMETMKCDMAGAATVLATVKAAAQLALPVKVTGLLALAENMPSGTATRVSDVLTMKGGTTVEVINTDAEGRLVLGDALVHASELGPDAIVDVATLTGAAVVALGERIGVLMASDDALSQAVRAAADTAGEAVWPLPLATEAYGERLEGGIADLRNAGSRAAGTIFAGLFLHRFVGEGIPWAHLDVAGVAWADEAYGEVSRGGTGIPVRTLLAWLRSRAA